MKRHFLKCVNPYFIDTWEGRKTFEIRLNDRGYEIGDELILEELETGGKTGRIIYADVPYFLKGEPYLPKDYVCMSIFVKRKIEL